MVSQMRSDPTVLYRIVECIPCHIVRHVITLCTTLQYATLQVVLDDRVQYVCAILLVCLLPLPLPLITIAAIATHCIILCRVSLYL